MATDDRVGRARAALESGRAEDCRALLDGVLRQHPNDAAANYLYGGSLLQSGRPADATPYLRKSCTAEPDNPLAANTLGVALFSSGHAEEAEDAFRGALSLAPNYLDAAGNLGLVLRHRGFHNEAYSRLGDAMAGARVSERIAESWFREAAFQGAVEPANQALAGLVATFPDNPYFRAGKAERLEAAGDGANAAKIWDDIGFANRRSADVQVDRVWRLLSSGDADGAWRLLNRVLDRRPDHAAAIFAWAHAGLGRDGLDADREPMLARIEAILEDPGLSFPDWANLRFAAGALADRLAQYDRAFQHYDAANKAVWRRRSIPAAAYAEAGNGIVHRFSPSLFAAKSGIVGRSPEGHDRLGEGLVFVAGMPRSGTTLVEQILSRGGKAHAGGERADVDGLVAAAYGGVADETGKDRALARLDLKTVRSIAAAHHRSVDTARNDAAFFIDKTPRTILHFGLLSILFPRAKFVHCVRAAEDTCLSCYFNFFSWNSIVFSYDLETLGVYYRVYDRVADHWRRNLPVAMHDIAYETLVDDPESAVRSLLSYCGLPFDSAYLRPARSKAPVSTASIAQARRPIYRSSIGRWKPYEPHLKPLLDALRT